MNSVNGSLQCSQRNFRSIAISQPIGLYGACVSSIRIRELPIVSNGSSVHSSMNLPMFIIPVRTFLRRLVVHGTPPSRLKLVSPHAELILVQTQNGYLHRCLDGHWTFKHGTLDNVCGRQLEKPLSNMYVRILLATAATKQLFMN